MSSCVRANEDDLCAPERWGLVFSIIGILVILCCSTSIQTGTLQRRSMVFIVLQTASLGITVRAAYVEEGQFLIWCATFFGLIEFVFDIACCCGNPARRDGKHSYAQTRLLGVGIPPGRDDLEEGGEAEGADEEEVSGVDHCLWWTIVGPAMVMAFLSPPALITDCARNDDISWLGSALFGIWEILAAAYCLAVASSFRGRFPPWSPEAIWFLVKVACVNLPGFVAVLSGLDGGLLAFLFQGITEAILFCAGVIESEDSDIDNVYDLVLFTCSKGGLVDYMGCKRRKPLGEPATGGEDDTEEETGAEAGG